MSCWSVSVRSLDEGVGEEEHQGDHQSCVKWSLISLLSRREKVTQTTGLFLRAPLFGGFKGKPRRKTHYLMLVWGASPKKQHTHTLGETMC